MDEKNVVCLACGWVGHDSELIYGEVTALLPEERPYYFDFCPRCRSTDVADIEEDEEPYVIDWP